MLPQGSHITRKRGVYYYRRRFPNAQGEIALSLRTRIYRQAEWLAQSLDNEFARTILAVLKKNEVDVPRVVREYLKRRLDFDLARRAASPHGPVFGAIGETGETPQSVDLPFVETELRAAKTELASRLYDHQRPLIDELMDESGVPSPERNELAHGILQANVELWETIRKRTLGEFPSVLETINRAIDRTPAAAPVDESVHPPLSERLPDFMNFMTSNQGWRGQTLAQNRTTYRMFIDCCGDRPIRAYERSDLAAFYDLLRQLPNDYSKNKAWRGRPLPEIARASADQPLSRISMRTVKRHFAALGRLFTYAKRRGEYDDDNPAHGFEFPEKGRARDKRKMWNEQQLAELFASPIWTGCHSARRRTRPGALIIRDDKYWLPLLGIYHGNRLEEFAQLRRGDIKRVSGIWYFDINDDDEKQIKNAQSKRHVPIHSEIVRLGFIGYVQNIAKTASDPIFPLLRPGGPDRKLGFFFTKWWSRYRQDIRLYEPGLDYHSFRHNVTNALATAGVSLEVRNALLGHEGSSTDEKVYLKQFPLHVLFEAINKVGWPSISAALRRAPADHLKSRKQDGNR